MGEKVIDDIAGMKFGMLTVLAYSHTKNGCSYWLCKCDCGNTKAVMKSNLIHQKTKSCGCLQRRQTSKHSKKHGESMTRLYGIWKGMRNRCYNPKAKAYKNYGGRGIQVCEVWQKYEAFREWALGNGYEDHLTIERKDCDGMYEPSNCTWVTISDQGKNTRKNRYIEHDGKIMSLAEWSRALGGGPNLVTTRLQRGWSEEDAVSTPLKRRASGRSEVKRK